MLYILPLPMEAELPLGMMEDAEFFVMHFQFSPEDKLMLLSRRRRKSDRCGRQSCSGFERVHELLRTSKTAAEVARVAEAFGQEDHISVIAVTRDSVREPEARPVFA